MRKRIALSMCVVVALAATSFADATLIFNDNGGGGGTPTSGSYAPGQTITFGITLSFSGPPPSDLGGYSLWFQSLQAGAPTGGIFIITGFDRTGSMFTDGQNATFPDPMDNPMFADNDTDMGASLPTATAGLGPGNYFIGTISILIDNNAPLGEYTIQNVFAPVGQPNAGHGSVAFNKAGTQGFDIPSAQYTVTVIPEPSTWSLIALGSLAFAVITVKRRRRV